MKVTEAIGGIVAAGVLFSVIAAMNGSHDTALSVVEKAIGTAPQGPQQPTLAPGTYGLGYVQQMTDAAYKNEMSFNRYYKGHPFDAVMAFTASHDHPILGGGYSVDFDSAACQDVTDPAIISMIAGW